MNLHSLAVCLGSRDNAANSLYLSFSLLPRLSEGLKRPLFLSIFHLALAARVINTRVAFSLFLSTPLPFSRVYSSRSSRLAKLRVRILVCSKLVRFESSTFERAKALFVLDRPTNVFSLSIGGSVMQVTSRSRYNMPFAPTYQKVSHCSRMNLLHREEAQSVIYRRCLAKDYANFVEK